MKRRQGLGAFWRELRRRRVVRTGGVYVAAAFVVLQLGEIVFPAFNAPDWVLQSLVVLAFLGLPVVLAFAWVYDLTPDGLAKTREEAGRREGDPGAAPGTADRDVDLGGSGRAVVPAERGDGRLGRALATVGPGSPPRPTEPNGSPVWIRMPPSPPSRSFLWRTSPKGTTCSPASSTRRSSPNSVSSPAFGSCRALRPSATPIRTCCCPKSRQNWECRPS